MRSPVKRVRSSVKRISTKVSRRLPGNELFVQAQINRSNAQNGGAGANVLSSALVSVLVTWRELQSVTWDHHRQWNERDHAPNRVVFWAALQRRPGG